MEKRELIYEGNSRRLYATDDPELIVQEFKDEAIALDEAGKEIIPGKGRVGARMSDVVFRLLGRRGVPTHHVRLLGENELLTQRLEMIRLEVVVRNHAAGGFARRLGLSERQSLKRPLVEFFYKNAGLGYPLLAREHIRELGLADDERMEEMASLALRANEILLPFFDAHGLVLADYKLEFGMRGGRLALGDEFSPDVCRLWDKDSGEAMGKDRYERDLGGKAEAYAEVLRRVEEETGLKVSVFVSPKQGVLDPAGQATLGSLKSLGFDEVSDVRIGKYITMRLEGIDAERAEARVQEMCERLLANPIIEDFKVEIER